MVLEHPDKNQVGTIGRGSADTTAGIRTHCCSTGAPSTVQRADSTTAPINWVVNYAAENISARQQVAAGGARRRGRSLGHRLCQPTTAIGRRAVGPLLADSGRAGHGRKAAAQR